MLGEPTNFTVDQQAQMALSLLKYNQEKQGNKVTPLLCLETQEAPDHYIILYWLNDADLKFQAFRKF